MRSARSRGWRQALRRNMLEYNAIQSRIMDPQPREAVKMPGSPCLKLLFVPKGGMIHGAGVMEGCPIPK